MLRATQGPRVRATLYVSQELLEQVRDAVFHLAGHPAHLTLASLADSALRAELEHLKVRYNGGQDFPERAHPLKGGRPIAA